MGAVAADTGFVGQFPPAVAPGNAGIAPPQVACSDVGSSTTACSTSPPRIDIVIEAGWRDGLEVQLLQLAGKDGTTHPLSLIGAAADGAGGVEPLVSASASVPHATVDVSCTAASLRHTAAASSPGGGGLRLLLRVPQMLDVTVITGCTVASDVRLAGKIEGEVYISADRGSISLDKVRGTTVTLGTAGSGSVTVGSLLETESAKVNCGSFSAAKVLGDEARIWASRGSVAIKAAYVRKLTVDSQWGAAAAPAGTPAGISIASLHGTATLTAWHGDIAVGGLTGSIAARAKHGSVRAHIDSARGKSVVRCAGDATVTLIPPVDLQLEARARHGLSVDDGAAGPASAAAGSVAGGPASGLASLLAHQSAGGSTPRSGGIGKIDTSAPVTGFYEARASAGNEPGGASAPAEHSHAGGAMAAGESGPPSAAAPVQHASQTSSSNREAACDVLSDLWAQLSGWHEVSRRLTVAPPAASGKAGPHIAPAVARPLAASLEVAAGGAASVSVVNWVTLMQQRMAALASTEGRRRESH